VRETYAKVTALDIAGKTFCESSTIHPDATRETEKKVVEKKAGFVAGLNYQYRAYIRTRLRRTRRRYFRAITDGDYWSAFRS